MYPQQISNLYSFHPISQFYVDESVSCPRVLSFSFLDLKSFSSCFFQIIITRTVRGYKWAPHPLAGSVTYEILVSSVNRENFLLNVHSLTSHTNSSFSKKIVILRGKELALLLFSICFWISNPSESYFIYTKFLSQHFEFEH